ncbi:D-alanyl-D-alanine carboxypeptidase [Streptomyces sp. B1866]|uniref:D-alanyl-D-alanine carboxypeptidase family protein n=1 Tax=Streptomyces sp. B1866 TaxID=3075431 RepID=UPI00288F9749|nr:D-alanyl-D-alanine carboxypeptidase [Streptomyces sp. B1866]MDT3398463.1 D-alanyl-D-alanine carboxypeptidase [Streptomyces sp. B1866]
MPDDPGPSGAADADRTGRDAAPGSDEDRPAARLDQRTTVLGVLPPRPPRDGGPAAPDAPERTGGLDQPTAVFGTAWARAAHRTESAEDQAENVRTAESAESAQSSETVGKGEETAPAEAAESAASPAVPSARLTKSATPAAPAKPAADDSPDTAPPAHPAAPAATVGTQDGKQDGKQDEKNADDKSQGRDKDTGEEEEEDRDGKAAGTPAGDPPVPAVPPAPPGAPDDGRPSRFVPLRTDDDPPVRRAAGAGLPESERTRQEPVPPAPEPRPLDLLAQLTNTPPPPDTLLRTTLRRVKIWTPVVVLLAAVFCVVQTLRPLPDPELRLSAESSYSFGGQRLVMPWPGQGQAAAEVEGVGDLGTYGAQQPTPIASVTKVMTAYVVLKDHPLKAGQKGPVITVDGQAGREADSEDESRVPVKAGQTFTEYQMLQLLLIPSGNNIARLLARWDAGTQDAFVKKMNAAATDLGMRDTTYTDPSGLQATTRSTAVDQLKLAEAAMRSAVFRSVVATPNVQVPGLEDRIYNNNDLLVRPGVIGIKTGSSTPAGGALMWAAVRQVDGRTQRILGVVLGQHADGILDRSLKLVQANSYKLITAVQDALTSAVVVKKGDVVGYVDDGLGGRTPVVATRDVRAVGWGGLTVRIRLTDGGKDVPHEAKAGTVVGELTVGDDEESDEAKGAVKGEADKDGTGVRVPVVLADDLSKPGFGDKLTHV